MLKAEEYMREALREAAADEGEGRGHRDGEREENRPCRPQGYRADRHGETRWEPPIRHRSPRTGCA